MMSIGGSTSSSLKGWISLCLVSSHPMIVTTASCLLAAVGNFFLASFLVCLIFFLLEKSTLASGPEFLRFASCFPCRDWSESPSLNDHPSSNPPSLTSMQQRCSTGHTWCWLSLNGMILPHPNPSSDRSLIKYTNQKTENAYGRSSGNFSILGLACFCCLSKEKCQTTSTPSSGW